MTEGSLPVMTADGTIDFGDVDLTDAHVTSVTPGGTGYLGTFVANVTNASTGDGVGQVTWLFAANNVLRQSLGAGQVLVQTYTVVIDDGHGGTASQLVTITINGTNDAAVITGETTGAVVEAGGVNNAIPGTPTDSGNLDATDVDDPADSWEVVGTPTAEHQRLRHVHDHRGRGMDLHTRQQQSRRAGAARRRPAGRQLHGRHHRRHLTGGVDHHHRHQRCAGGGGRQQRRRCGDRERGRGRRPRRLRATC